MPRPVLCKRDPAQEKEVQTWIEGVSGKKFPSGMPIEEVLKDGILLCEVMNKLSPGSIKKINTTGANFKMMENITNLHKAMMAYGVDKADIFQTNDLFEKKDIANVVNTCYALGRAAYKNNWSGPNLGPKPDV